MTLPISVIMISLNEAHHLPAVLQNLDGFAEQVFLVDSYSADDTVDIALAHGVHVVQRAFRDFGDQWNYAIKELPITTPWVMKLDPDERLTEELKVEIAKAVEASDVDGFGFRRRLWLMGKPMPVHNHVVRIWRHGKCQFSDVIVNEHPLVDGPTRDLSAELEHHDSPNLHHWFDKQNQYTTAEAVAQFHAYGFADTPNLFGTPLQRQMWLKKHFWNLPGRYGLLYLYHLFWAGAWRAGKTGRIWARLRTELYRNQEFKLCEMKQNGQAYISTPTGTGPPHPKAIQGATPPPATGEDNKANRVTPLLAASRDDAIQHHERLARGWAGRYNSGGFKRRAEYFQNLVLPQLDTSGNWLDAGCGSGNFARILAEHGATVRGIDAADGMVTAAEILANDHEDSQRMSFARIETVEDLPEPDAVYDGVLCLSVLEYLPDPEGAMREFARVLKSGGQLSVSLANSRSPVRMAGWVKARLSLQRHSDAAFINHSKFTLSRSEVSQFFQKNGFEVTSLGEFDPVLPGRLGAYAPSLFFVTAIKQ